MEWVIKERESKLFFIIHSLFFLLEGGFVDENREGMLGASYAISCELIKSVHMDYHQQFCSRREL